MDTLQIVADLEPKVLEILGTTWRLGYWVAGDCLSIDQLGSAGRICVLSRREIETKRYQSLFVKRLQALRDGMRPCDAAWPELEASPQYRRRIATIGEHVIPSGVVKHIGEGDADAGHAALDEFCGRFVGQPALRAAIKTQVDQQLLAHKTGQYPSGLARDVVLDGVMTRLRNEIEALKGQLPQGMEDCTIVFNECAKGHGWLTAKNWVQHGCPTCALDSLKTEIASLRQAAIDEIKRAADGFGGFTVEHAAYNNVIVRHTARGIGFVVPHSSTVDGTYLTKAVAGMLEIVNRPTPRTDTDGHKLARAISRSGPSFGRR